MSSDPSAPSLGSYTLLGKLGEGGMGEVHLARDARLERNVALKLLPEELRAEPERRTRFLREARAVAQLSHPNITQIFEIGEDGGRDFIAFELVEGRTLHDVIAERSLTLTELVDLALPLADAIAYAHERGIVHRDLKAANVMVTVRGHPKLLDFGLAKVLREDTVAPRDKKTTTLTIEGAIFGTPGAMSPEQALGKPIDSRSDIFSFGSLLFELASGRPAFQGGTVMEVMDAVIHKEPDPLGRLRADLPAEFIACVAKALRKDPGERYQTMNDLAADLRHWKRATDSGLVPPAEVQSGRRSVLLGFVGLVLVVVASWFGWRAMSSATTAPPAALERRSLAVLPFSELGGSADDAGFAAGLHSDVLTRLAKLGALKVISRTSVLEYAGTSKALREIGGELGADAILSGEVQRLGAALRLNLTLHDAASEDSLWAESYNRELTSKDLFAVQSEIAEAVATALQTELSPSDERGLRAVPTTNDEAYDAYLSARALSGDGARLEPVRRQLVLLESAVEKDPGFALAWAALSEVRGSIYWLFEPLRTDLLTGAFDAAREALRLDPDLAEGHMMLGKCHYISRDYEAAKREYEIAERGLPNSAELLAFKAYLHRRTGQWERAADELRRALELSPRDMGMLNDVAVTQYRLGNFAEAERHLDRQFELSGAVDEAQRALCVLAGQGRFPPDLTTRLERDDHVAGESKIRHWEVLLLAGDLDATRAFAETLPDAVSGQSCESSRALLLAITDDVAGDTESAERNYRIALDLARAKAGALPGDARPLASVALALAGLGERDEALREAQRAVDLMPMERDNFVGGEMLFSRFHTELRVGALDDAVRTLDEYVSRPCYMPLAVLVHDPRVDALKDHAGFQALCERDGVR